jgi:hypothetical protein
MIDLSREDEPVPTSRVRHISPRIAEAYAGKTDKTVIRDINHLITMGLVERTRKGIRAKPEIMFAFLPRTRLDD